MEGTDQVKPRGPTATAVPNAPVRTIYRLGMAVAVRVARTARMVGAICGLVPAATTDQSTQQAVLHRIASNFHLPRPSRSQVTAWR